MKQLRGDGARRPRLGLTLATAAVATTVLATTVLATTGATAQDAAVHVRGSGALVPAMQKIAEAYMATKPDATIVIRSGDTEPGLKALLDGRVDVALASAAPSAEIQKRAKSLNVTLKIDTLALDGVAAAVHPANPASGLSRDQLTGIYTGIVTNWSQLGGEDAPILVLALPPSSGTAAGWREMVIGDGVQTPKAEIGSVSTNKSKLAAHPNAIAYLPLGALDAGVKALTVDGAAPSPEAIRAGAYPLRRSLSLVALNAATPSAQAFVRYALSAEGRALAERAGLLTAPAQ